MYAWARWECLGYQPHHGGEVHALLYITGQPLCTDDIMERLRFRGNASMSLRACRLGIVEREHRRGDRKEYFRAEQVLGDVPGDCPRAMKREARSSVRHFMKFRDSTIGRAG